MSHNQLEGTTLYYYEHYPHYLGTINSKVELSYDRMAEIAAKWADDEDIGYDLLTEYLDNNVKNTPYALNDVMSEWDNVVKDLSSNKLWGDLWEEGSHAISTESMEKSRSCVGKIELEVAEECGEW